MIPVLLRCVEWKKRKMTVIEMLNDNVILGSDLAAVHPGS